MKVIVKAYPASENDLHVLKGALKSVLLKAKAQGACECEQKDITLWAFQNSPSPFGGRFLDDSGCSIVELIWSGDLADRQLALMVENCLRCLCGGNFQYAGSRIRQTVLQQMS